MSGLAHHVALAGAAAALLAAGFRAAAALGARGLERVVAATVTGVAAAVLEAMALGLVELGGTTVALLVAALLTWGLSRAVLPDPEPSASSELAFWWADTPVPVKLALGAVAGAGLMWAAWLVRHPALGLDSVQYHLTEAVIWVREGSPGAGLGGLLEKRTSIPLVSEVLVAWQLGLSRSLVPAALLAPASMLLLVLAGWLGLRTLGAGRRLSALAIAALCATPMISHYQYNGAHNDLPALAFLVATAALAGASRRTPALMAPALLAGGLAAGTKTTALPLTVLVLGLALWAVRSQLRELRRPLLLAAVPALVLGSFWYLRDLVEHGSPFWPDLALPWGDPASRSGPAFLDRPRATLDEFLDDYLEVYLGGLIMLAGAFLAPLVTRRREVLLGAAVTAASMLLWLSAPTTGAAEEGTTFGTLSTLRYTLPALAAAITTLALGARGEGPGGPFAVGVLGVALAVNVFQTADLGFPNVPGPAVPLLGAALGAAAAFVLTRLRPERLAPLPRGAAWAAGAAAVVSAGAMLAAGAPGFLERHARAYAASTYGEAPMIAWLARQPEFRDGSEPVAMSPVPNAPVVGDDLGHRLELIPLDEPCTLVRERVRRGWVLLNYLQLSAGFSAAGCLDHLRPAVEGPSFRAYRPASGS